MQPDEGGGRTAFASLAAGQRGATSPALASAEVSGSRSGAPSKHGASRPELSRSARPTRPLPPTTWDGGQWHSGPSARTHGPMVNFRTATDLGHLERSALGDLHQGTAATGSLAWARVAQGPGIGSSCCRLVHRRSETGARAGMGRRVVDGSTTAGASATGATAGAKRHLPDPSVNSDCTLAPSPPATGVWSPSRGSSAGLPGPAGRRECGRVQRRGTPGTRLWRRR